MTICNRQHYNDTTKAEKLRLRAYRNMLRKAYRGLPAELRDTSVQLCVSLFPIQCRDLGNHEIAAKCYDSFIVFIARGEKVPDYKSLRWLLSHEMSHWKLKHGRNDCPLTLQQKEIDAVEYGTKYGFPWKPEYCFKSTACN